MRGACLIVLALVTQADRDATAKGPDRPFGIDHRVAFTTGRVVGSPEPTPPYRLVRALPKLSFESPLHVANEPNSNRLLVLEYHGKIWAVEKADTATTRTEFLKIPRDLYGLTFHPNYTQNRFVYVFTHTSSDKSPKNIVSRFTVTTEQPRHCDPQSEVEIISWESNGHDGGDLAFGPKDGMLYISAGDSTTSSDPKETGQDLSDLLSSMIRIDVDHPDPGKLYAIPPDNPFVNHPGARPEIWAYGFRNPWRFCFDPANGRLWMGDIGQDVWEMIEIVDRGSNHGWSVKEGPADFLPKRPKRGPTPFKPPIVAHHHVEARSITGGFVYQGERFPDLKNAYVYGDFATGRIWALRYDDGHVTDHREIADSSVAMLGFANDRNGDVWAADYTSGQIYRLEQQPPAPPPAHPFPRRLSETGLFANLPHHEFAPGVVPYSVNSPLWSDAALKKRAMAVPGEQKVDFNPSVDTPWGFPEGTVLAKTFSFPVADRTHQEMRVETRLLALRDKEWEGYSYLWNDDQTDAVLVGKDGLDRLFTWRDAKADGGVKSQSWHFPSRAECMVCHSRAAGFVLGLSTGQLNRDYDYSGKLDNQLRVYEHIGLFSKPLAKPFNDQPKLPDPYDVKLPIDARARSYLHTNCSICHVESGGGNARFQLRFSLGEPDLNLFDEPAQHNDFGIPGAKLVSPGHPERSVLLHRVATRGSGKMPPLATSIVDEQAVGLLREWIAQRGEIKK